jgi:hypothetical protein
MVLPFGLVGFLTNVFKVLADEKITIFAISAYSADPRNYWRSSKIKIK